eukprot:3381350-Rhodomonas_salina.2
MTASSSSIISPAHYVFEGTTQVSLHWFATNTQVAKLNKTQFCALWTESLQMHSGQQDQNQTTMIDDHSWHKGPDTAAKCLPPVMTTSGGHTVGTS